MPRNLVKLVRDQKIILLTFLIPRETGSVYLHETFIRENRNSDETNYILRVDFKGLSRKDGMGMLYDLKICSVIFKKLRELRKG